MEDLFDSSEEIRFVDINNIKLVPRIEPMCGYNEDISMNGEDLTSFLKLTSLIPEKTLKINEKQRRKSRPSKANSSEGLPRSPSKISILFKRNSSPSLPEIVKLSTLSNSSTVANSPLKLKNVNINPKRERLVKFLTYEGAMDSFRLFLRREYSEENIFFLMDMETYKNFSPHTQERLSHANYMMKEYISDDAPKQINISQPCRTALENDIKRGIEKMDDKLFLKSQKELATLLECDSYLRYLVSEEYQEYLSQYPHAQS